MHLEQKQVLGRQSPRAFFLMAWYSSSVISPFSFMEFNSVSFCSTELEAESLHLLSVCSVGVGISPAVRGEPGAAVAGRGTHAADSAARSERWRG